MSTARFDIIFSFSGLISLWWFWYYCWKPYALSRFRQDIFDLRDDLFDAIVKQRFPVRFDSQVYIRARQDLNKMIRFAHEAKPLNVVIALLIDRQSIHAAVKRSQAARDRLTTEEKSLLKFVDVRQEWALRRYLFTSSFLLWLVIILMLVPIILEAVVIFLRRGVMALRSVLERRVISCFVDGVEHQAGQEYLLGGIDSQGSRALMPIAVR